MSGFIRAASALRPGALNLRTRYYRRVAAAVEFPDPAVVAQIARLEGAQARAPVTFSWPKGIAFALAFALAGGALFAGVVYATQTRLGILSIVNGVVAGIGAARGGRSREAQIVGAAAAAIGYFAGMFLMIAAMVGMEEFFSLPLDRIGQACWLVVKATFSSIDALFLGIAVYWGWKIPRAQ
jgi:hypothetical protein